MIQSIQKIIKIGSSGGVTIPAKELRRQNIAFGDEVEVIVRPIKTTTIDNSAALDAAKKILNDYRGDFKSLASR
ncbi:hypothetical protein BH10PAT4_BH10PAT4_3400 [soil metagenome]